MVLHFVNISKGTGEEFECMHTFKDLPGFTRILF